jgi:hypothetical protein
VHWRNNLLAVATALPRAVGRCWWRGTAREVAPALASQNLSAAFGKCSAKTFRLGAAERPGRAYEAPGRA